MSECMFGVSREKPTRSGAQIMERIAEKHGAYIVETTIPGTGYQLWFAAPNRGFTFDARRAARVLDDLRTAGVLDDDGRLAGPYRARKER